MATSTVPTSVLSQQLSDQIGERRVRCAVFTTFSFDPAFFELNVLPLLFHDRSFSQPDKVRRIQLDDALRAVDRVAVYFDMQALAQDGAPAHLDYRRIDVSRRGLGYFHPKVILLLVDDWTEADDSDDQGDNDDGGRYQALIVGLLSANLTRSGWWENVECAHLEEIKDKDVSGERCPFRPDLLALLRRIGDSASPDDDQSALEQVRQFVLNRTVRERTSRARFGGVFYTGLFCGQNRQSLVDWLYDKNLHQLDLNLEVISPFFDDSGAGPLEELIGTLAPRETRVFLPTKPDGSATISQATHDAVAELATWSRLPAELVGRGRTETSEKLPPRRVHAKVYRLWRKGGPDVLVVGSPNLTRAGFSHSAAGNLEAAFLVDVTHAGHPQRWWLEPVEQEVTRFAETDSTEADGLDEVGLDLSLQFDWGTALLSYRLRTATHEPIEIADPSSGRRLVEISKPTTGRWMACGQAASDQVRALLRSTSFLRVTHRETSWRVLIREENMGYRPSLLLNLRPEEILEYWSLLTAAQRADLIERLTAAEIEGLPTVARSILRSRNTMFDRFGGIYHAFGCLGRHVADALENDREREAEARLLGAKYDSLPQLLQKTLDDTAGDPIVRYVTFLCAKQLRDRLRREYREFFSARKTHLAALDALLGRVEELRDELPLESTGADRDFLDWYEAAFLKQVSNVGVATR